MYCPECGTFNEPTATHCSACGTPLRASQPQAVPPLEPLDRSASQRPSGNRSVVVAVAAMVCIVVLALVIVPMVSGGSQASDAPADVQNQGEDVQVGTSDDASPSDEARADSTDDPNAVDGLPFDPADKIAKNADFYGSSEIGNLVNGGHMDRDDNGLVYYAAPVDGTDWDTRTLVCCNVDGSGKQTIYTAPDSTQNLYHISVVGDRVVFNQEIEGNSTVMSVGLNGENPLTIDACDDWSLCQVDEGWVYYLKNGILCRCDMEGNARRTLYAVPNGTYWRVCGSMLYTLPKDNGSYVEVSALDGTGVRTVYRTSGSWVISNAFPLDSTYVLIWEKNGDEHRIMLASADGTLPDEEIWSGKDDVQRVCTYDGGVVLTSKAEGDSYKITTINFDGPLAPADIPVSDGGEVRYTCFLTDRIFYGVVTDGKDCSIRSMGFYGEDKTVVAD